MKFSDLKIGANYAPFIIAEMSGNHNGSLERALKIVDAVAEAGAHAIKLQTYTADTLTLDVDSDEFRIDDPNSPWDGYTLYELYNEAHTPWEWHQPIFQRASEKGLVFFSSPFDSSAVDFLENLNVPMHKIASFEAVDLPLIRRVASTGKPMIISTGLLTASQIDKAVQAAWNGGAGDVLILKCTSSYPADPANSNLRTLTNMRETFGVDIGLSDHTIGIGAAIAAVALGANVVEKHVTLARDDGGVDSTFSLEPWELKLLVSETSRAWAALGKVSYAQTQQEKASRIFQRSLYLAEDVREGEVLTTKNLRSVRPGYGLAPEYLDVLLGKTVNRSLEKGSAMRWEYVG